MKQAISVPVHILTKNSQPYIELRRAIGDFEAIKEIIAATYNGNALIIYPTFLDKLQSTASLLEKGIIRIDSDGNYQFLI